MTDFLPRAKTKLTQHLIAGSRPIPRREKPRRVFGHNIDVKGNPDCKPDNDGYRLMVTLDSADEAEGAKTAVIRKGKFLVTGIEGNFENDPSGAWITAGWKRMDEMFREKNLRSHPAPRWFERRTRAVSAGQPSA